MNPLIINCFVFFASTLHSTIDRTRTIQPVTFDHSQKDSIPYWVRHLYEKKDTTTFENETIEVTYFKFINDTTSYSIYTILTGTCLRTNLATQRNRRNYYSMEIGRECDQDLSLPYYSHTTYKHDSINNSIILTVDDEEANPKYLEKDGNFKKGYDMESGKTIHHIIEKTVRIAKSGRLKIQEKNSR